MVLLQTGRVNRPPRYSYRKLGVCSFGRQQHAVSSVRADNLQKDDCLLSFRVTLVGCPQRRSSIQSTLKSWSTPSAEYIMTTRGISYVRCLNRLLDLLSLYLRPSLPILWPSCSIHRRKR